MKKIVLFILLTGFLTTGFAQEYKQSKKRAEESTTYVADDMKLNKERTGYLLTVLTDKYIGLSKEMNGKDLSKEEKKVIYKASREETKKKLLKKFSKEEFDKISTLLQEYQKSKKKA